MERMSTLDAGFFYVEHDNVPMHMGSLALFEGPAPSYDELARLLVAKLPRVPRYRQVVRTMPLEVLRPMWADDEHFEIGHHLRHATVPAPGGKRQLRELAASIFATRLDRVTAAVGDMAAGGAQARPLGDPVQGAPLHGGRCRRQRPDDRGLRRHPRRRVPRSRRVDAGARPGHAEPDGSRPPGGGVRVGAAAVRPDRAARVSRCCPRGRSWGTGAAWPPAPGGSRSRRQPR